MSETCEETIVTSSTKNFEPEVNQGLTFRRHFRHSSLGEFDFIRQTGRAIDDVGTRLRAMTKARVTELDNLGILFVAEARYASAKTCEIARHVGEKVSQLVGHSALPSWMKDNEFIHFGYRPELKSVRRCFRSIFHLHTETGNIWTHLVGCVAFLVVATFFLSRESLSFVRDVTIGWQDRLVFGTFFVSAICCLLFSTLFHTLCCHSQSVSYLFSKLDYCGIALLIMGSAVPWLYYAFYCELIEMLKYVVGMVLLGSVCIAVTLLERFGEAKYRPVRAGMFIAFGLSAVIPAIHVLVTQGPSAALTRHAGDKLLLMAALYITGALIYAARIPERFLPGRFDFFCHSHQIFHVFVVAAAFVTLFGLHEAALNALELARCDPLASESFAETVPEPASSDAFQSDAVMSS